MTWLESERGREELERVVRDGMVGFVRVGE